MNKRSNSPHGRFNLKKAFMVWLLQHTQACVFSAGQLLRNPVNSFLTTSVVGIALSLPAGFYLVLDNCQRVVGGWDRSAEISLFLKTDTEAAEIGRMVDEIGQMNGIAGVQHISREEALKEFLRQPGVDTAVLSLEENPLPDLLLLRPQLDEMSGAEGEKLLQVLRALPEVDAAQFDRQWIQRLFAIMEIIRQAVVILSAMLAIAVLLIVGNTIRLAIFNRRTEIEVNKLFGATDAFIQRPFLYTGFFHGLGGALMAWALLGLAQAMLVGPVGRLAALYSSSFSLQGLSPGESLGLLLLGATLGLVGSLIAVKRHLRDIEPA